jgi:hypothetical protein
LAIINEDTTLLIENYTIENCSATVDGLGLYINGNADVTLRNINAKNVKNAGTSFFFTTTPEEHLTVVENSTFERMSKNAASIIESHVLFRN